MREILFRGKRWDNGTWVTGCPGYFFTQKVEYIMPKMYYATKHFGEFDEKNNPIIEDEIAIGGFIRVIPETVGQFTGLTDTKGQKIFDGDIIKFKYNSEDFETASVFWSPDYLGFFTNSNGANHPLYDLSEIEIIGNIHDNTEDKA